MADEDTLQGTGVESTGSVYDLSDDEFYEVMGELEFNAGGALAANPEAMKEIRKRRDERERQQKSEE